MFVTTCYLFFLSLSVTDRSLDWRRAENFPYGKKDSPKFILLIGFLLQNLES